MLIILAGSFEIIPIILAGSFEIILIILAGSLEIIYHGPLWERVMIHGNPCQAISMPTDDKLRGLNTLLGLVQPTAI